MNFFSVDSYLIAIKDAKRQRLDIEESVFTVRRLLSEVQPVTADTRCVTVLDNFIRNQELSAVAIVDVNHQPIGIVDRGRITEIFLKPYSRDLLHKKQITEIMDTIRRGGH